MADYFMSVDKRNRRLLIVMLILCFSLFFQERTIQAQLTERPPYERIYQEIGYKEIDVAHGEAEKHFNQKINLPFRVPPVAFTHQFARFSNLDGAMNDSFEITMISDQSSENHYKIVIRPLAGKLIFKDESITGTYQLLDQSEAHYIRLEGFNLLVFEKDVWQYKLMVDKRISDIVTPQVLVEIANSIGYPFEQ